MFFIIKNKSILLFLLNIEIIIILIAILAYFFFKLNFLFVLIIGVLEAVFIITFLVSFIRYYGRDKLNIL